LTEHREGSILEEMRNSGTQSLNETKVYDLGNDESVEKLPEGNR
jgi:hypothetical protein